jgi:hypothetical protein
MSGPHGIQVGAIIVNSWGWEQTNVDWYIVVRSSASNIWLMPIEAYQDRTKQSGPMSAYMMPHVPARPIETRQSLNEQR